ncbi:MAG: hypothetical protein NW205_13905, partial [Hyphomicrobiaceae bacterium]|nr:hypothetical protein [Hyphomicrobiaceae bacterium]
MALYASPFKMLLVASSSLVALAALMPEPAQARRGFGVGVAVGIGAAILLNEAARASQGNRGARSKGSSNPGGRKGGGDGGDDAAATAGPSQITARDQADNARQIAKQQEELAEYERSL